jgi:anti-anti-sigma factor
MATTMNLINPAAALVVTASEPNHLWDLVLGNEQLLLDRVAPLVRNQSVTLDLTWVERIDAAGIAALVELYRTAHTAGHHFTVVNAMPHVAQILALVGLDRYLMSHNAVCTSHCGFLRERTAA